MTTPSPELQKKYEKAKSLLVIDHPFFGAAVLRRPLVWDASVKTTTMSADGQITINPEWAEPFTVKNLQFLLAHEAMHHMLGHVLRRKHRKAYPWNVAADKVINDLLIDAGIGDFIEGGVNAPGSRNFSAEELYEEEDEGEGGEGNGPGGIGNDIGDPVDGDGNPLDQAKQHEIEVNTKVEMIQNAKAAKAMGKLPAGLERLINELVAIKTPWHEILERYMAARIKDDYSWSNPNRRFVGSGVYVPGQNYVPKMGEVVVVVDTSGSIGQRELDEFNGHINRILEACGPEKVHVVYVDAAVNAHDEYSPDDFPVKLTPHGGGGTDLEVVYPWIAKQGIDPEVCVFLTDGYTDFTKAPPYPVVWLMTTDVKAPYGENIKFEKE